MVDESTPDPLIGALLDGRFRVLGLLGRGGMGNVYAAEETRLKRRCALKVMHAKIAEDRDNVERFLREAQMIAQLEHPNIVDIHSFGEEPSGLVFFAMEMLTGEDLDARLKARRDRPFSIHEACMWAVQIARAVAVVHDAGLIHRDLKTSNVFLARRRNGAEVVKLLDFGIARPEEGSELTRTGTTLGTPSYMSPEQIRNDPLDRRTDIYSFGVLLFKLLTSRLPFSGEPIHVAYGHCEAPRPLPSTFFPEAGIPSALDAIVVKAMAKRPVDRYQSMHEVEEALLAVLLAEAPDLAAIVAPGRTASQSHPPVAPTTQPSWRHERQTDPATPNSTAQSTGPTAEMKEPPAAPRGSSWLYFVSAGSLVGVLMLLGGAWYWGANRGEPAAVPAGDGVERSPTIAPVTRPADGNPPPAPREVPAAPVSTGPAARPEVPAAAVTPDPEPRGVAPSVEPAGKKTAPRKSDPAPPRTRPDFSAAKARDRLAKAIKAGTESCWQRLSAAPGFEFEVQVKVSADGTPSASGSPNSALRRCLFDLITPRLSLGATATGGELVYVFRRA